MRKCLFIVCCMLVAMTAMAENYPYRSDYLWVTVPDHADWIYKSGENANIEVQLYKYGIPMDGAVTYEIADDMMTADKRGSINLRNGKATINIGSRKNPGFRDLRLTFNDNGNTTQHHVKVAFSPEKIEPYTTMPDDFDRFWNTQLDELAQFPLKYTKEAAPEYTTDKVDCYLIKLQLNKQGQCVFAYLFYPKNATTKGHPVVLCPPGAGIKTIKEPLRHKYYAEDGMIRMEMEIHGLDPRMTTEQFNMVSHAFNGSDCGYLEAGIDSRDRYYMRRVYLSLVKCIDLLTSLPEWDGRNVAVQGGSQGGALAIIAAGLDKRVSLCVANHPALSDMAAYKDKGRTGGYPHFNKKDGFLSDNNVNTLLYYDVINFARRVTCPTYMTWGYNDDTCPPTTSYAVWNTLTCPKESLITPINEHWTSEATEYGHKEWIKRHLK